MRSEERLNAKWYSYAGIQSPDEDVEETHNGLEQFTLDTRGSDSSGIPVDSVGRTYYIDTSESHNIIIGSTGCGKSRRLILPYLYSIASSGENCLIHDPKGELHRLTAERFKEAGYKVMVLDGR